MYPFSVCELADEFGTSHVTVLRAVDQLRPRGFCEGTAAVLDWGMNEPESA